MSSNRVIVTRHAGLVQFLNELGITGEVIGHATADNVRGKEVIGVLPLHLAALAQSVTSVDMELPSELRGVELSSEQVRKHFVGLTTYKVMKAEALNGLVRDCYRAGQDGYGCTRDEVHDLAKDIQSKA